MCCSYPWVVALKPIIPEEAVEAVRSLNPKIVIPTHYRTAAAGEACEIVGVDDFIALMSGTPVTQGDNFLSVSAGSLPSAMKVEVLSYAF